MSDHCKQSHLSVTVCRMLFVLLLTAVLSIDLVPSLRAGALELVLGGEGGEVIQIIDSSRVIVPGSTDGCGVILSGGQKVTLRHGKYERYATSREGESVGALLQRLQPSVDAVELIRVDIGETDITVTVASDMVYYETVTEDVKFSTVYTPVRSMPKGETVTVREGADGQREVIYEVIYSDGRLTSRQAVEEKSNTSVPALVNIGTLVKAAADGDTVQSVSKSSDGSGYLTMTSGDTLHFTGTMEVKCTAYTTGHDRVGTITYTGTTVRRGCVAVDKRVIPLGTTMYITSDSYCYGMGYAEDTGVRGEKIDLYMDTYEECIRFGVRRMVAYLLDA